jgi:hypothetical protein
VFIRWFLLICVITFALKLLLFRSITEVWNVGIVPICDAGAPG